MVMDSVKFAPWGSTTQGDAWSFEPEAGAGLVSINIWDGDVVDAISFVSQASDGRQESSPKFGGGGGGQHKIVLDWPREYPTAISGTYREYNDFPDVITSLKFTTNLGITYGPFGKGDGDGTTFALTISRGAIVGFHGRRDDRYLHAIGLFVRP